MLVKNAGVFFVSGSAAHLFLRRKRLTDRWTHLDGQMCGKTDGSREEKMIGWCNGWMNNWQTCGVKRWAETQELNYSGRQMNERIMEG